MSIIDEREGKPTQELVKKCKYYGIPVNPEAEKLRIRFHGRRHFIQIMELDRDWKEKEILLDKEKIKNLEACGLEVDPNAESIRVQEKIPVWTERGRVDTIQNPRAIKSFGFEKIHEYKKRKVG